MAPAEVAARARACLGARFRLHGRDPALGLDCVGLAAFAFAVPHVPAGYPLRGGEARRVADRLGELGFEAAGERDGRLLLLRAGPFQHHLAVTVPGGFVHADAGLRRVVEVPGRPRWPVIGCWSREGEE